MELSEGLRQQNIWKNIRLIKFKRIGHVLKRKEENVSRISVDWDPESGLDVGGGK